MDNTLHEMTHAVAVKLATDIFVLDRRTLSPTLQVAARVLDDTLYGLDDTLILPKYEDFLSEYVSMVFTVTKKTRISPRYSSTGEYKGIDFLDYNIPSIKGTRGLYVIFYEHPISGDVSVYVGSTIRDPRERIGKFVRRVMTDLGDDDIAAANKWIKKHGRTMDYASAIFIPIDAPQSMLRALEDGVIEYYNGFYPSGTVLNSISPQITLEHKRKSPDTPALLDI